MQKSQFPVTTDYSKWERRNPQSSKLLLGVSPVKHLVSVGAKSSSSPIQHVPALARNHYADNGDLANDKLNLLELRLNTKRKTLDCYMKRERELLSQNLELKREITAVEAPALGEVKLLLRKYEKFRGGMSYLNETFLDSLIVQQNELANLKTQCQHELSELQRGVDAVDGQLKKRLSDIHVLQNYKDKEYPVKAMRISELMKEIDRVDLDNDDERDELEHVVDMELNKLRSVEQNIRDKVMVKASDKVLSLMHPSLKDMALQNQVMRQEIDFHTENISNVTRDVELLKGEVERLLKDPVTNLRLQVFPEFFENREKCTPDMDVVLDIQVHEWLPL